MNENYREKNLSEFAESHFDLKNVLNELNELGLTGKNGEWIELKKVDSVANSAAVLVFKLGSSGNPSYFF